MLAKLLLAAVMLQGAEKPSPQAVVLEQSGRVVVRLSGQKSPLKTGQDLRAGSELLVFEDAHVVLLYRDGKCSRVAGPAKVSINERKNGAGALSASFRGLTNVAMASTVGGVRDGQLEILSPRSDGLTPRDFRLGLRRKRGGSRALGGLSLADEVRIFASSGAERVFQLALPPYLADGLIRSIELSETRLPADSVSLVLEIRCLSEDEDDLSSEVVSSQRSKFTLASIADQQRLDDELARIEEAVRKQRLSLKTRGMLRYGCFLRRDFIGEATAEAAEMARLHPNSLFWRERLETLVPTPRPALAR